MLLKRALRVVLTLTPISTGRMMTERFCKYGCLRRRAIQFDRIYRDHTQYTWADVTARHRVSNTKGKRRFTKNKYLFKSLDGAFELRRLASLSTRNTA